MSHIGLVDFLAACSALGSGLSNLLAAKGTPQHRLFGYLFVIGMSVINVSALSIYRITGQFNIFHGLAIINLAALVWAMEPFFRKSPGFVQRHARRMPSVYLGLCAAAANELLFRVVLHGVPIEPGTFWQLSAAVTAATVVMGTRLMRHGQFGPRLNSMLK